MPSFHHATNTTKPWLVLQRPDRPLQHAILPPCRLPGTVNTRGVCRDVADKDRNGIYEYACCTYV
jgi:hypothetical protein